MNSLLHSSCTNPALQHFAIAVLLLKSLMQKLLVLRALSQIMSCSESLAKVWVDELQSHFECDFELE